MSSSATDLQGAANKLTAGDSLKKYLSSRRGSGTPPVLSESDLTQEEKVWLEVVQMSSASRFGIVVVILCQLEVLLFRCLST